MRDAWMIVYRYDSDCIYLTLFLLFVLFWSMALDIFVFCCLVFLFVVWRLDD